VDNPRRQLFAQEYVKDYNATQAAIRSGYSPKTAKVQGSRLLTYADVRQAVEAVQVKAKEEAGMTAVEVLKELAALACSNVRHYAADDDGRLTLAEGAPEHAWRAVSSVKYKTRIIPQKDDAPIIERDLEFRLWDKNTALTNLAKRFALLVERHEVNITQEHLMRVRPQRPSRRDACPMGWLNRWSFSRVALRLTRIAAAALSPCPRGRCIWGSTGIA
jgi:phage terminase small subunit